MENRSLLAAVRRHRIIVALRGLTKEQLVPAVRALREGGIRMVEVTFDQSSPAALADTPAAVAALRRAFGEELLVGAGTVVTVEQLRAAAEAGAQYMLSPNLDLEVMAEARRLGLAAIPGALTPSETAAAWKAGAALVKLFPVGNLGPGYVRAVTAPLSHIPLLGMGGINRDNLLEYLALPSMAGVGVGAAIAKLELIRSGDWAGLTALARTYTDQLSG